MRVRISSVPVLFYFWRCCVISNREHQINEEILDKEVRLIGSEGEQLGIMSAAAALKIAEENELDLVKIAPGSNPPVCKIMDYGKFRFEQTKKEKEAKKNQRVIEIKEIRMSPGIDTNDFNIKVKNCIKFLQNGDKVKVTIRFRRAREMSHMNLSEELMKKFLDAVSEYGGSEKPSKLEGKNYAIVLSPKK